MRSRSLFLAATLAAAPFNALSAELVMFEQTHCVWCDVWHEEIGVVYKKTDEGKRAPLRRVDIHDPMPVDLSSIRQGRYTPTFVLVENGAEIGRITGYSGEDFFWPMLNQLIDQIPDEQ